MKKSLPIGIDNFKEAIEQNCYYVDKTNLIEELVTNASKVKLFPRPRRFGKTMTISMIDYFFNIKRKEESKEIFNGLYIENSEIANPEKNKYPVISLNFKGIEGRDWKETFAEIKIRISKVYRENKEVKEVLDKKDLKYYENIENEKGSELDFKYSLLNLTNFLESYYKEKVIVLVDEYDAPIDSSYHLGFYDNAINFFRGMYTEALKTNNSLKFAVLTGVVRISSESMFSKLNHIKIYGIMDINFSEYFGFTEKEVIECLKYYEIEERLEDVRKWYNGYIFGKTQIYNPWSILNFADGKKLECHWVNTGENLLLKKILRSGLNNSKENISNLLSDKEIKCIIDERISYKELSNSEEMAMTMLLLTGYLTVVGEEIIGRKEYKILRIPNEEVRREFERLIEKWLNNTGIANYMERFNIAVVEGDFKDMEYVLNEILLRCVSYQDNPESLYHGIVLCMLVNFGDRYIVKSNREVGYGRYDLSIEAKDNSFGAILEFKIADKPRDLDKKVKEAIQQIENKEYDFDLKEKDIFKVQKYGIAFTTKKARVLKAEK